MSCFSRIDPLGNVKITVALLTVTVDPVVKRFAPPFFVTEKDVLAATTLLKFSLNVRVTDVPSAFTSERTNVGAVRSKVESLITEVDASVTALLP